MKQFFKVSVCALAIASVLSACGGGSSGDTKNQPSPTSTVIKSSVVKGVLRNAQVKAYRFDTALKTYAIEVGVATTDASGSFSLNVTNPVAGEVLQLRVEPVAADMVCDASNCNGKAFGEVVSLAKEQVPNLMSYAKINADGSLGEVMSITPISTLLVGYAQKIGDNLLDNSSVQQAREAIKNNFKLTDADLNATPIDITNSNVVATASPAVLKLSLLAAAVAEQGGSKKTIKEAVDGLTQTFVNDQSMASLTTLTASVSTLLAKAKADDTTVQSWLNAGSTTPVKPTFDALRLLNALPQTAQADLLSVLQQSGVADPQKLIAQEIAKTEWTQGFKVSGFAAPMLPVLKYSLMATVNQAFSLFPLPTSPVDGLTVSFDSSKRTLTVTGQQNGYDIDVKVVVPTLNLLGLLSASGYVFDYTVTGSVSSTTHKMLVDGKLRLDASANQELINGLISSLSGALFGGSVDATKLTSFLGDIIAKGQFSFAYDGVAKVQSLVNTKQQMGMQGKVNGTVNMAGGVPFTCKVSTAKICVAETTSVSATLTMVSGAITLPNTWSLTVGQSQSISIQINDAMTATVNATLNALNMSMPVTATFTAENMGFIITHIRNKLATVLSGTGDLATLQSDIASVISDTQLNFGAQGSFTLNSHVYDVNWVSQTLSLSSAKEKIMDIVFSDVATLIKAGQVSWRVVLSNVTTNSAQATITDDLGAETVISPTL